MRALGFVVVLIVLNLVSLVPSYAATGNWTRMDLGTSEREVVAVVVDPNRPAHLFAATSSAVLETADDGHRWEERFRIPGQATASRLAMSPSNGQTVLLGTDQGLYSSFDAGITWGRTFRNAGEGEERITTIKFASTTGDLIYLGTAGGVFRSQDGGRHWDKLLAPPQIQSVIDLACDPQDPDALLVLSSHGLFVANLRTGQWQHVLKILPETEQESSPTAELDTDTSEEELLSYPTLTSVALDPSNPDIVYVGGRRGIQISRDRGTTWSWLPQTGMTSSRISRLLLQAHSPVVVYASTEQGVARYRPADNTWELVGDGLISASILDLTGTQHRLWAASEEGLLQLELPAADFSASQPPSPHELLANFVHEPTIGQVRDAAIRYAEVHPSKIARWRRQAALKALLPSVDIGWDRDTSHDTSIDEGSFPNFQVLSTKDLDSGVDFSINWDLGELIWNDDQTSIDVRSKLMVQLRDDIVDQATRTYFERRRLQVQLLTNPPTDPQKLLEQELRLQELTALIDGLTGGEFSRRIGPQPHQEEAHDDRHHGP